ncbi:MAG: hypothetical protein NTV97_05580 [Alphaproteobacteria bacterium]|nr:hypothetical protein [Alphaproteobacteria bacterium]
MKPRAHFVVRDVCKIVSELIGTTRATKANAPQLTSRQASLD